MADGCSCDDPTMFDPWDPEGSMSVLPDGTISATSSVSSRWRIVGTDVDPTGTFLTVLFRPTEGDPPA